MSIFFLVVCFFPSITIYTILFYSHYIIYHMYSDFIFYPQNKSIHFFPFWREQKTSFKLLIGRNEAISKKNSITSHYFHLLLLFFFLQHNRLKKPWHDRQCFTFGWSSPGVRPWTLWRSCCFLGTLNKRTRSLIKK